MTHPTLAPESSGLSLQESVLAASMFGRVGNLATKYVVQQNGDRIHPGRTIDSLEDHPEFIGRFAADPKDCLAFAREELIGIAADPRLGKGSKERRLDRYLDAYIGLTVKMDAKAFPKTPEGRVHHGIPEYVPDGFNDMGRDGSLNPQYRDREIIHVDKAAILQRYKPVLARIFSTDYSKVSSEAKKKYMVDTLAAYLFTELPYDTSKNEGLSGKIDLASMRSGVCRHQALTFQVLAQACGLTARMIKGKLTYNGRYLGSHAANMVRADGSWYIVDPANPDHVNEGGNKVWRIGAIKVDRPIGKGEKRRYEGNFRHSGTSVRYDTYDDMFWTIG